MNCFLHSNQQQLCYPLQCLLLTLTAVSVVEILSPWQGEAGVVLAHAKQSLQIHSKIEVWPCNQQSPEYLAVYLCCPLLWIHAVHSYLLATVTQEESRAVLPTGITVPDRMTGAFFLYAIGSFQP